MIRYIFINNQVLEIYRQMREVVFPLDIKSIIDYIPNCRYMSYQVFARINNCSIDEVVQLCESKSGCTHYDIMQNRYLILCNQSTDENNNLGRQRWTCGHEIGHVICNHLTISAYEKLSENSLLQITDPTYEAEANYFAATILSPFPLYKELDIHSAIDVQRVFGLSAEASLYRYKQYLKWRSNRIKTAWENDMIRNYRVKC